MFTSASDAAQLDDEKVENVAHTEQPIPSGQPQTDVNTMNEGNNDDPYAPHVISTPSLF